MKTRLCVRAVLFASVMVAACLSPSLAGPPNPSISNCIANELIQLAEWRAADLTSISEDGNPKCQVKYLGAQVVTGDVMHYEFRVRVGDGEFDWIGLHRVVRAIDGGTPIRTRDSAFLLHGDIKDFEGMFIPGTLQDSLPREFGFAVTLAEADVDVWGIDQGWSIVPFDVTDFDFMADWGLDRQIDDMQLGIAAARAARRKLGNGNLPMIAGGFSSGALTGFALLEREAELKPNERDVAGFLAMDFGIATDDPDVEIRFCEQYQTSADAIADGDYQLVSPFPFFGPPAKTMPDAPSPLIPGFTNLQAALVLGAFPQWPEIDYVFVTGEFDEFGIPTGLRYTDVEAWIDFMVVGPPYQSQAFARDYGAALCPEIAAPWGRSLEDVEVPVYYLSARQGAGPLTLHTLDLLGSEDVTLQAISLDPDIKKDFGHVDVLIARDAEALSFEAMRDWIQDRTP